MRPWGNLFCQRGHDQQPCRGRAGSDIRVHLKNHTYFSRPEATGMFRLLLEK